MENPFYKVMNRHSDEELLDVYKNRSKYTPEAVEAMEMVLSERKLMENAAEIVAEQKEEEALSKEEQLIEFQLSEFGEVISDEAFARESLKGAVYLQRFLSPLHHYNWLNHLFIVLGIVGLTLSLVIVGIGEYPKPFITILVCCIAAALLLPFGIWRLSKNKAQLTILKKMNRNVVSIEGAKDQHEISLPLRYECHWQWHYTRKGQIKFKQVMLHLFLYDDKNDSCFELRELMPIQKTPPPHWEMLPEKFTTNKTKHFVYWGHGFQKPFLYQFQKILAGLQEGK
jgi:hypothetical protein